MVKVVPKIMALLELFSSGEEVRFSEVMARTGLSRSNASHLLGSLCANSVLTRSGYGLYRRGERLLRLSTGNNLWRELSIMAERCADNLVAWLNELAVIGLRFQGRRLILVKRKPVKNLQVDPASESRHPTDWYATASGRILLAFAPESVLSDVVRHCGLPARATWSDAVTLPRLRAQLAQIREQGFVLMNADENIRAIGVPVADASGEEVFSVATAFPVFSCHKSDSEIISRLQYEAESFAKEVSIRGIQVADLALNTNT